MQKESRPASLIERRLEQGLSLVKAATLMGVHWTTLKAAEGGSVPRIDAQQRIADFYGATPLELWPMEKRAA